MKKPVIMYIANSFKNLIFGSFSHTDFHKKINSCFEKKPSKLSEKSRNIRDIVDSVSMMRRFYTKWEIFGFGALQRDRKRLRVEFSIFLRLFTARNSIVFKNKKIRTWINPTRKLL